jgi:hypothetical protein
VTLETFEAHVAAAVRNEHLNFVDALCGGCGTEADHPGITFDGLTKRKSMGVTVVVTNMIFVNTETLIYKCRLAQASISHARNWMSNFRREEGQGRMDEYYQSNELMDLLTVKSTNVYEQETSTFAILRLALSVLVCYYQPKM